MVPRFILYVGKINGPSNTDDRYLYTFAKMTDVNELIISSSVVVLHFNLKIDILKNILYLLYIKNLRERYNN